MRSKNLFENKNFFKIIFALLLISLTTKYHLRFNEGRKFIDLQNVDFNKAVKASIIDERFNNLKWITATYKDNPLEEINYLKESVNFLKKENKKKMVITHYQFFSVLLNENLNIPNRWYFPDNTFPSSENNNFYKNYKNFLLNKIKNNNIGIVYIIMEDPEFFGNIFLKYFNDKCKFSKKNKLVIKIEIKNCI